MQEEAKKGNLDAWRSADIVLHETIFGLSKQKRTLGFIRQLNDQWYRFQTRYVPLDLTRRNQEHVAFVQYILEGDPENAKKPIPSTLRTLRTKSIMS